MDQKRASSRKIKNNNLGLTNIGHPNNFLSSKAEGPITENNFFLLLEIIFLIKVIKIDIILTIIKI